MKKMFFLSLAICAMILCSCGEGGIKPKTTKITGPLGEFFEVVNREYKYVNYENNTGLLQLNVEIKRIKEGGPKDASWSSRPTFTVSILDGDENVLATESTDVVFNRDALESLFALGVDETSPIAIQFDKKNTDGTAYFKVASKWDADEEESSNESDYAEIVEEEPAVEETSGMTVETGEIAAPTSKPSLDVSLPSALKGNVEIIAADKYIGDYGFPTVDVTFKLLKNVNTSGLCSSYGQMWIVGIGQDSNGVTVRDLLPSYDEWRSGDSDGHEFKDFLEGEVGETITLSFTGDNNTELFEEDQSKIDAGKAKTEAGLEKVEKFKLTLKN